MLQLPGEHLQHRLVSQSRAQSVFKRFQNLKSYFQNLYILKFISVTIPFEI